MATLERAGCERIVVDNGPLAGRKDGMLGALISHLGDGDALVVLRLEAVANSVPELIDLALELEAKNVRFRSLTEGFDTHGRNRAATKAMLSQLQEFERQIRLLKDEAPPVRRAGRPRSLSPQDLERARELVKKGRTMDEVAKELQVSRATLYRYLENGTT